MDSLALYDAAPKADHTDMWRMYLDAEKGYYRVKSGHWLISEMTTRQLFQAICTIQRYVMCKKEIPEWIEKEPLWDAKLKATPKYQELVDEFVGRKMKLNDILFGVQPLEVKFE